MELITVFFIAAGLSVDSFVVSVCSGLSIHQIRFQQACKIAFSLAIFQGAMPVVGWFIGSEMNEMIKEFDHWIAFTLLAGLGSKMIYESVRKQEENCSFNPENLGVLLSISIATSIDALVVGFSLALIDVSIWKPAFIITFITFIAAMLGMLLGKKIGNKLSHRFEIIGGIVLILIGLRILIEHLFF